MDTMDNMMVMTCIPIAMGFLLSKMVSLPLTVLGSGGGLVGSSMVMEDAGGGKG